MLIKVGQNHIIRELVKQLSNIGYERSDKIDVPGSFSVSGGNIVIFPVNMVAPATIEFFGSRIEAIYEQNAGTLKKLKSIAIGENNIFLPDGTVILSGNFLVHEDYGIGCFISRQRKRVNGGGEDYYLIQYANDVLYLPAQMIEKISRYIGVGRRRPKLSRLGGNSWKRTYQKTYESIIHLARELLLTYAQREIARKTP